MIPHSATVATAQPVFFRVAYNTSQLTKIQFQTATYHLCYNYYNFGGPIKVPMVCMYAHKFCNYVQDNHIKESNVKLAENLHFL